MTNQELLQIYSAYLPYAVDVLVDDGNGKYIDFITGIGGIDDLIFLDKTGDWYYNDVNDFTAKLVLRPLSDLEKEIEHNGEKFVPIKEIGDKYFGNLKRYECDGEISYGWDEQGFDDAQGYQFSFCEESMVFGVWYDTKEEGDAPIYSVGGYNDIVKLFEWHFDVFDLHSKGLCIYKDEI